jgi:hypothetical protein
MNQYGAMAMAHWNRHRPVEYAAMANRERFFQDLGDQIEARILDRAEALEQAIPADQPFQDPLEQMMAARPTAQREVLEEMLPRAEDDETGE